jgi:hypothetical protein
MLDTLQFLQIGFHELSHVKIVHVIPGTRKYVITINYMKESGEES